MRPPLPPAVLRFGAKLHQLRLARCAERNWLLKEFAYEAGLVTHAVTALEKGRRFPTMITLYRLASALGVRPERLLP